MKKRMYIVTGAAGHLGSTVIRLLSAKKEKIRALIMPSESGEAFDGVQYFRGDVRDIKTLMPMFENTDGFDVFVIHTAGIVDISDKPNPVMYDVNVNGTRNMIDLCRRYGVRRLVYVSSVHAIPEKEGLCVMTETDSFSPETVNGYYAKSKAEATREVLEAAAGGLDAVVVHPSGIIGPYDTKNNHIVQLLADYLSGKLPACVRGGYDFVDVRDVAAGCISAAERGRRGECYILSNRHYDVSEILLITKSICGKGRRLPVLPSWLAKAAAPVIGLYSAVTKRRPLYTAYSIDTLRSNDRFSHDKATAELGYRPRDLYRTVRDTVAWLKAKARGAVQNGAL